MASIHENLSKIINAVFGRDIRQALHDGLDAINKETESTTSRQDYLDRKYDEQIKNMTVQDPSSAEIVDMRVAANGKTFEKAGYRLNYFDEQLDTIKKSKTNWINVVEYGVSNKGDVDETENIQRLIDLYPNHIIYFPSGKYLISQLQLPLGTTLQGDGLYSTTLKATTSTDMIVLKDYLSAYVSIKDIFIDGDYKATRGIWAYKEQYSLEYLDNSFKMENVYVKRCTIANIQLGKDNTASMMECKLINVKSEQGLGKGIHLTSKCTDSYFEGVYSASNVEEGFYIEGYNLKLLNCKACWNGTIENKKSGFYFLRGSFNTMNNCESQDNYGHGLMAENTTNLNADIITDRNGNGGFDNNGDQIAPQNPSQYGIYIKDSYYIKLNTVATNGMYMQLGKYTQKGALGVVNSYFITANIQASHQPYYFIVEDKLSYNLDINANGTKWQNILPKITINETTQDGITFKQLNDETFSVNGTAAIKTKIDLVGVYGNTTPLMTIPGGSILKIKNANIETNVQLLIVVNKTTVLSNATKEAYITIEEDTHLSEVALVVDSGKIINNAIITPTLEIISKGR